MKKNKLFAPFLMLLAGAIVSIAMYCFHYTMKEMLPILLAVLLIFYIAGCFIQKKVFSFMEQIREKEAAAAAAMEEEARAREELSAQEKEDSSIEEAETA